VAVRPRSQPKRPKYDRNKFSELLLYVAERCDRDPRFGLTKLNKILFFADFYAYGRLGKAITGAAYQRLANGPAARAVLPTINELKRGNAAQVVERDWFGRTQKRLSPKRPANLKAFTADEIKLVDGVIAALWDADAATVSDLSHEESLGWQLAAVGEDIPYATVFLSSRAPSFRDLDRGKELAQKYNW